MKVGDIFWVYKVLVKVEVKSEHIIYPEVGHTFVASYVNRNMFVDYPNSDMFFWNGSEVKLIGRLIIKNLK